MYPMEIQPMLCEKNEHYKMAKGKTATLETMMYSLQWMWTSSFQIGPCKMGTEVGIEPHCDWNTTKEDERDVSIHPTNTEWLVFGNILE